MEFLNKEDFYAQISKHLQNPKGVIAITQDANKLQKPWATASKYNWTLQDTQKIAPTIAQFIEQLPNYGFTDGAILSLRRMESLHRGRTINETVLKFANTPPAPMQTENAPNNPQIPQPQPPQMHYPQQMAAPVINGMAYASLPQHEVVSMKVKEERYLDLVDKYKKAEEELSQCKSDLRIEKEKLFTAERKLETIEDRWELKLEREVNGKKSFIETETGQALAGQAISHFSGIITALKGQPQMGMGNPLAMLSESKQQVVEQLKELDEPFIPLLSQTITAMVVNDGFAENLLETLTQLPKTV